MAKEYIEREAVLNALYDNEYTTLCPLDEVSSVIDAIPAADVVEVVRCRECKHWHKDTGWCDKHSHFVRYGNYGEEFCHPWESADWKMFDADYWCKDGERRDKMRLIDADALTSILEEWEEKACDGTENDGSDGTTRVLHPVPTTTREMIDLIADQPTIEAEPQWIPVTERFPEEWVDVLAFLQSGGYVVAARSGEHWRERWTNDLMDRPPILWMPLPHAPEDGGNDNVVD